MHLPRVTLVALLIAAAGRLTAQDVIFVPPSWKELRDSPQELPKAKWTPAAEFPRELKTTTDYGYVVYDLILDNKGKVLALQPHATLEVYERASRGDRASNASNWTPGKRDGKGVNTETSHAFIFNPASAAEKKPDAAPRLLDVSLVEVTDADKDAKRVVPDQTVMADVTVDAQGTVTAVKNAPAEWQEAFAIAVKNWRFAPARREGVAVAADVRVPFVVVTRGSYAEMGGKKPAPPRVISQTRPIYPFIMRASRMKGEVLVDFIVDIEGRVRNAYVVRSLNASFDDPAVEAVLKWRFEPAQVGERPVAMHMQVPVIFTLNETYDGGDGPFTEGKKPDMSKWPEQFRYDTAPKPTGSVRAIYPYALLRAKKEGKAVVSFVVDQNGRVARTDVIEATAPELGRALQAAVECFTYTPAIKGGKPSLALQGFKQEFDRADYRQLVSEEDLDLLRREEKKPETIVTLREIDGKLKPLSQRPPRFPQSAKEGTTQGDAEVEFLVDEDGRVRLPRIVSASEEPFGYAAVQGVATWRFEPPKRGGRPAVVRVQVPIHFGAAAKAER